MSFCSVSQEKAKGLGEELVDGGIGESKPTLETIDLKLSSIAGGVKSQVKLDLRLKLKDGKLELVAIRMSERKILTFDIICLHRY